jgi:hypothetical protein
MSTIFNRVAMALRVLFARRILLIEARRGAWKQDRITLWGTVADKPEEIKILRALADSIERDHQREERQRLVNLNKQKN